MSGSRIARPEMPAQVNLRLEREEDKANLQIIYDHIGHAPGARIVRYGLYYYALHLVKEAERNTVYRGGDSNSEDGSQSHPNMP